VSRMKLRVSSPPSGPGAKPPSTAGRVGATLFFLFWLAIPTVMLVLIGRDTVRNARTWRWPATPCTIVSSGVEQTGSDGDYAFRVEYAYSAGRPGKAETFSTTSAVYSRGYKGSSDYAEAQRLALRFPPGTKTDCYVNPADPSQAVLKRSSLATAAIALFPMLFIAIGLGGLWFTWNGRPAAAGAGAGGSDAPLSTPMSNLGGKKVSAGVPVVLFAVFVVMGGGIMALMGARVLNVFTAGSWRAVPATVVSSRVRSHSSGEGTTYSVDVLYHYEINGREYRANRYGFMRGSSSGYDGKRAVVNRFPPGARVTAFVNPSDPADAVLERGFTPDMLFLLIPGVFLAIGLVGLVYSIRRAARLREEGRRFGIDSDASSTVPAGGSRFRSSRTYTPRRSLPDDGSPVALSPRQSPGLKLLGVTIAALFWNGIISIFLYKVVTGWKSGHGDACLTAFMLPFVAIGIALVVAAVHTLLALFNPRPVLVLGGGGLSLGASTELRWSFTGKVERVHQFVIRLEGREEATYRQGTDTRTDKSTFFSADLVDTTSPAEIANGKTAVQFSADSMHSFESANNKIIWVLTVHGHIRHWADVKEEYVLSVAPRPHANAPANAQPPQSTEEPETEPREASWNA